MDFLPKLQQFISISRTIDIARRYLVVNGFDGALTTLGLLIGFYINNVNDLKVSLTACLSAAIALGVSGFSSAYVSESAERKLEFSKLQEAMVTDLSDSAHSKASFWAPFFVAFVNGLSPLLISIIITTPLWLAQLGYPAPMGILESAIAIAFIIIFLLGVFLSNISGEHWIKSGLKTVGIALLTTLLVYLIS